MKNNKIIPLFMLCFLSILVFSCKTKTNYESFTKKVSINPNVKEFSYLEAKKRALETVGLENHNPVILNASYDEEGYNFVFYPMEPDAIFAVNVRRYTGDATAKTFRNTSSYSYLDKGSYYILADLALNIAATDANIELNKGYSYRAWMEPFGGTPVYFVIIGDIDDEYKYTINASLDKTEIMSKDVYHRPGRPKKNNGPSAKTTGVKK